MCWHVCKLSMAAYPSFRVPFYCYCLWTLAIASHVIGMSGVLVPLLLLTSLFVTMQIAGWSLAFGPGSLGWRAGWMFAAISIPVLSSYVGTAVNHLMVVGTFKRDLSYVDSVFLGLFVVILYGAVCNFLALNLFSKLIGMNRHESGNTSRPKLSIRDLIVVTGIAAALIAGLIHLVETLLLIDPRIQSGSIVESRFNDVWQLIAIVATVTAVANVIVCGMTSIPLTLFCVGTGQAKWRLFAFWRRTIVWGCLASLGAVAAVFFSDVEPELIGIVAIGPPLLVLAIALPIGWSITDGNTFTTNRSKRAMSNEQL